MTVVPRGSITSGWWSPTCPDRFAGGREALGLRRAHEEAWGDSPAVLEANGSGVALFPSEDGGPILVDDPMRHVGFRTSRRGLEAAKAELRARDRVPRGRLRGRLVGVPA